MTSLEHIAKVLEEKAGRPPELSPKGLRVLKSVLNRTRAAVETNTRIRYDGPHLSRKDFEDVGEIEYLLTHTFPKRKDQEGEDDFVNVPPELSAYVNFVRKFRGIDAYREAYEDKITRDGQKLVSDDSVAEADDSCYARMFVQVVEADDEKPGQSTLLVKYEGQELYRESLPETVFAGIPKGSKIIFDYSEQGLRLNLHETLEGSIGTKKVSAVEKIVLESLARDSMSMGYVDLVYDQINKGLSE